MIPTERTAAAVAICAIAALIVPPFFALLGALAVCAAAVVDAVIAARSAAAVEVELDQVGSRGIATPYRASLLGRAGGSPRTRLRQPTPPDLELEPDQAPRCLEAELTARRRGRHLLGSPATRTIGPLGLGIAAHPPASGDGEREIHIYPDLPAARRIALAARSSRFRDPGSVGRGPLGLGTEFEAVRDYQPDDDIRQVNWRATARLGRPMSNDYRLEQDRDVICVIDSGRLMAAPVDGSTRLDIALDAMTALAAVADEVRDRFGALAFDSTTRLRLRPTRDGGRIAVRALFDLEPTPAESDYLAAFRQIESEKRAFVVLFTDLVEQSAARPLLEAVPILARRHAVVVAGVVDPGLTEPLREPSRDSAAVMDSVVALEVNRARVRVAGLLRASGATVIEAPPDRLGAACVRAYLSAKARARL